MVNGWHADSGETIDVTNPATGDMIGTIPKSGKAETARAIAAAHEAFQTFQQDIGARTLQHADADCMMRSWITRRHWRAC